MKPYKKNKHSKENYRHVGLTFIASLLFVMIVVPTIIVMLPNNTGVVNETSTENVFLDHPVEELEKVAFDVSVKRSETGEVEVVPLEQYVVSVVASEMPADFEEEALKAQAVAARTYIVNHLLHQTDSEDNLISDTTEHQVYKNEAELKEVWGEDFYWKFEKVNQAVLATENQVITYDSQPITPTFFSMSNGYTENAEDYWGNELPYLKKVESKWEESLPNFIEQKVFTKVELNQALGLAIPQNETTNIKMQRTNSERVNKIEFDDVVFTGKDIREKLNLRSSDFSIQQKNDHFVFTTKGFGHGVGMSQYGANGMALEGNTYEDILHHYYQNIELESIVDAAPALVATLEE